ncbi:chromatin assembly factor 1 subunit B-like [Styela clava]
MKVTTPEISWHAKEAIYSVDIQPKQKDQPLRVATAGIDSNVRIWELKPELKTCVTFLSNLTRHEKAVNIVRFSKSGSVLASGGDDGTIILWRLSDKNEPPNIFDDDADIGKNIETWNAFKMLRGHVEDINDLSWSNDGDFIISGSIDHTAIMWDVAKGSKLSILTEAKHFIHGVAWDPLDKYAVALSCDRSMRVYNTRTRRILHNVSKMVYPEMADDTADNSQVDNDDENDVSAVKPQRMFHDETVVRRRLDFTCDGNLLIVPSGCLNKKQGDSVEQINTAYIFTRGCLSKPSAVLPGFKQPVTVIRCCPVKFHLREMEDNDTNSSIDLPYRLVFAVAATDTLLLYDTQHLEPFALIGNIHYAAITDISWSSDGQQLLVSSRDGFCTIIQFSNEEIGKIYSEAVTADKTESSEVLCNGLETETTENSIKISEPIIINDDSSSLDSAERDITSGTPKTIENSNVQKSDSAIEQQSSGKNICATQKCKIDNENKQELNCNLSSSQPSLSQEKKSRRVQLVTLESPCTKTSQLDQLPSSESSKTQKTTSSDKPNPRRIQLTTIQSTETDTNSKITPKKPLNNKINHTSPAFNTPKFASSRDTPTSKPSETKKKQPRRIQLTQVNN